MVITEKIEDEVSIIIFGASGDLSRKKLLPALFNLYKGNALPPHFKIICFARSELTNQQLIEDFKASYNYGDNAASFFEKIHYIQGDYTSADSFKALSDVLNNSPKNRLIYLATPPQLVKPICENLKSHVPCIACRSESECQQEDCKSHGITRIILEKPFGSNLATAQELNKFIWDRFLDEQVYRIDHYLGKETVQNILAFRFANSIFESIWNNNHIEHIEINISEEIGIDKRAEYFDYSGITRDIIQNHALQLLALVCMEPPISLNPKDIRHEKTKLLKSIRPLTKEEVPQQSLRAQYQGYLQEKGVRSNSQTETFSAIKFFIDNWRWANVPIYIRTGKALNRKATEIRIYFKKVPHHLFGKSLDANNNILLFRIQPQEGINLQIQTKVPGTWYELSSFNMDFSYQHHFTRRLLDAYERLLLDCLQGDPSLFLGRKEVEASWRFIDSILDVWKEDTNFPLYHYKKGQMGPDEMFDFIKKDQRTWALDFCQIKI